MNKRGQQAMEYLITHGWMIFVSVLVAGAMVYFGVFDSDRYIPQQCIMTFDFGCEQYAVKTDGEVRIKLSNQLGEPIAVSKFMCTYEDGTNSTDSTVDATPISGWFPGQEQEFLCDPGTTVGTDKKAKIGLSMSYRKETGGFVKTVSGSIISNPTTP